MALGRLQKLKKEELAEGKKIVTDTLVIGSDIFSYYLYQKLAGEILFVVPNKGKIELMGPCLLRGDKNREIFMDLFPAEIVEKNLSPPVFFREQRFREFGGRSKPEKLLAGEVFYTNVESCFNHNIFEIEKHKHETVELIPTRIYKNSDGKWIVYCSNGDSIYCNNILWGEDPKLLEKILDDPESCECLLPYTRSLNPLCVLHMNFKYEQFISDRRETIFIPVSYTHDWGHFIGKFSEDGKCFECIYHIDKTETSEDEVTKKIKILKRSIEKIFPQVSESNFEEEIIVKESSPCERLNDSTFAEVRGLYLFGMNAPLENGSAEISHLARGLLTVKQVLGKFNLS